MKKRLNARLYRHRWIYISFAVLLLIPGLSVRTYAKPAAPEPRPQLKELKPAEIFAERRHLYESIGQMTDIPWYRLAAIDQYERTLTRAHPKDRKHPERLTGIFMTSPAWRGWLNPDETDQKPQSILVFGGYGRDGSGDGMADANNDVDVLYSMAEFIRKHGNRQEDFNIALWEYYHNSRAVQRIQQFAKLYEHFDTLDLFAHAFPVPLGTNYSYRSTWGTKRSWGGYRIHEGTDIFAPYGLPVRSTCYGIVEVKGWNPFGGWRIGIRDLNNHYHYYAHLSGFDKKTHIGQIVTPGQIVGWVGSSGYGKPGTQGKFPPHLHYGIYRDSGLAEWSFDPYPLLNHWEKEEYRQIKAGKKNK